MPQRKNQFDPTTFDPEMMEKDMAKRQAAHNSDETTAAETQATTTAAPVAASPVTEPANAATADAPTGLSELDDDPLVDDPQVESDLAELHQVIAELREQNKALEVRLSKVNEMDLAVIDAELHVANLQSQISEVSADLKKLKDDLKQAVHNLRAAVNRRRTGQMELFKPDDLNPVPAEPNIPQPVDPHENAPITLLSAKEIKKIVGKDEFEEWKARGEPIGLTEKQLDTVIGAGWNTIGQLEKAMRENSWWMKELKGFGEDKINRLISTHLAFRQKHPLPAEVSAEQPATETAPEASEGVVKFEWEEAIEKIDALLRDANERLNALPGDSEGIEFMESVTGEATEMLTWIREHEHVTDEQLSAIANWTEGVAKWQTAS